MTGLPLLTTLIAVPLIAGGIALFLNASGARWIALIATLIGEQMTNRQIFEHLHKLRGELMTRPHLLP